MRSLTMIGLRVPRGGLSDIPAEVSKQNHGHRPTAPLIIRCHHGAHLFPEAANKSDVPDTSPA